MQDTVRPGTFRTIWQQISELWAAVRWLQAGGISGASTVNVNTAGGAGFAQGTAAAPYAVKSTDRYVKLYADSGATQVGVQLSAGKFMGERHTFWYLQWSNAGNPSPLLTSTGCEMTVIAPNEPTSNLLTNNQTIGQPYSFATFEWDGTEWLQV